MLSMRVPKAAAYRQCGQLRGWGYSGPGRWNNGGITGVRGNQSSYRTDL